MTHKPTIKPRKAVIFALFTTLAFSSGCANLGKSRPVPKADVIEKEIREADARMDPAPHSQVPIEINDAVHRWIDYFSVKDRERFETFLVRGAYYRETIEAILKEHGVPLEMYYLAMIESGFVPHATSHASAVGIWQFIRSTGRRYNLNQSPFLDERRDVIRATHAAARYLSNLYQEFGSWYLAMAAYNAGEGRIRGAIRKGESRDFWVLSRKRVLPRETINYVPKFLAAWIIGKKPERFGFNPSNEKSFPALEKVSVPGSVHVTEISRVTKIDQKQIAELNPHLIRGITPPERRTYDIWLPKGSSAPLRAPGVVLAKYPNPQSLLPKRSVASRPPATPAKGGIHRVRKGETLHSIARRYRVSLASLKRMNGLQTDRIYKGQSLKVQPSSS